MTTALAALVGGPEPNVPAARLTVEAAMLTCENAIQKSEAREVLAQTTRAVDRQVDLPENARVRVRVVRGPDEWDVVLSSASRGQWQTLVGWTFAPNNDEEFYTEPDGDKFVVRRRARDEGSFTSLPSAFWTWLPTSQAYRSWQHGPTAGLGVTVGEGGSRPAVFGGYLLRWNQNIGLVAGVAVYPHRRLDGRYTEGQTIGENLDGDKLNNNSTRGNWFVGAVFHFGSDPRKAKDEGKKEDTKKDAK